MIIIGAGPSGMMAAISAAEIGATVALIDKNKKVGKKLLLTGGGRCNVTNAASVDEIIANVPGNGRFLHSAFAQFSNREIISFFTKNGVTLKEEDHGRLFPVTNQSKTIVDALFQKIKELGIHYFPNTKVTQLLFEDDAIKAVKTENLLFYTSAVILATGGKTYPSTGSTGDGYALARAAGHTITPLYATESALISQDSFILDKRLQGISLNDVALGVQNAKGKTIVTHQHDLLFTHFGLSGPAALRCSSFVNQELSKGASKVTVKLDFFPQKTLETLLKDLTERSKNENKSVKNIFSGLLQERLLIFLLEQAEISPQLPAYQMEQKPLERLAQILKSFQMTISATFPLEKSFVTGGGVLLKQINPKTLESKLCNGLFISGELLDINGYTGGYNITCAFVTGWVAGFHAANRI